MHFTVLDQVANIFSKYLLIKVIFWQIRRTLNA